MQMISERLSVEMEAGQGFWIGDVISVRWNRELHSMPLHSGKSNNYHQPGPRMATPPGGHACRHATTFWMSCCPDPAEELAATEQAVLSFAISTAIDLSMGCELLSRPVGGALLLPCRHQPGAAWRCKADLSQLDGIQDRRCAST
jgi:hypothetical protein